MKQLIKSTHYVRNSFLSCFVCIIATVLLHTGNHFPALGIPFAQIQGEIDYRVLVRWLAMMTIPLLLNGYFLSRCKQVELLSLIHLKSIRKWMAFKMMGCVVTTFAYTIILLIPTFILFNASMAIKAFSLLLFNNFLWMFVQIIMDETILLPSASSIWVAAILCFSFVLGEHFEEIACYLPSTWGMLCRASFSTKFLSAGGWFFLANLALNLLLCLLSFYSQHMKWRRKA